MQVNDSRKTRNEKVEKKKDKLFFMGSIMN